MPAAVNRNGRVLYVDGPATFNAVFPAVESVRLDEVRLIAAVGANASLDIYDDIVVTAARKIARLEALAGTSDDFIIFSDETIPPDIKRGMTVVLTGAGSEAWIYLR